MYSAWPAVPGASAQVPEWPDSTGDRLPAARLSAGMDRSVAWAKPDRFAFDGAQPEAVAGVEAGRFQPVVVEGKRFRQRVFQKQLAVIGLGQRLLGEAAGLLGFQSGLVEKQVLRIVAHGALLYLCL